MTRSEIWATLFEQQTSSTAYKTRVSDLILSNNYMMFSKHEPLTRDINVRGWTLREVNDKEDSDLFWFGIYRANSFPVNQYLRNEEELEYLPLRDYWHDTFGHLAILNNRYYSTYLKTLAHAWWVATEMLESPRPLVREKGKMIRKKIDMVYWFTAEFGAVMEDGVAKAYGAGIVSSINELNYFASDEANFLPVNENNAWIFVQGDLQPEYEQFQKAYLTISSYKTLGIIAQNMLSLF